MKNFQFIFIRLSLYLVAGILVAFYVHLKLPIVIILGAIILVFYLYCFFRFRSRLFRDSLAGIATFLLIFYMGYFVTYINLAENQSSHYIHQNLEQTDSLLVEGTVAEVLKPTTFHNRYILNSERILQNQTSTSIHGKLLINIYKDSTERYYLRPGEKVLLPYRPLKIKEPLNPFQFSYRNYLSHLKIERQLTIQNAEITIIGRTRTLSTIAWNFREALISGLKRYNFKKDELAIFQALILGQRNDISDTLYKKYAAAGAIHILAISGLHIGILLLFLNALFKPLEKFKYGKIFKTILLLTLLWSFAFITGLSPSVLRAVCMFSFIAVGMQMNKKTSSLNSVFLSFFFLLIIDPFYLFQVGFQLSYLAVLSIILFQPIIYKLFSSKIKLLDYFWKICSVSIAAQIGVLPLSLYYFHQFPGLFLASNLVILPFLSIILIVGITVIGLANLKLLPEILQEMFTLLLRYMNLFVEKIAGVSSFVITDIPLSILSTLILYLIIIAGIILIRQFSFRRAAFFLLGIILFQSSILYVKFQIPKNESVIFHRLGMSLITEKHHDQLRVLTSKAVDQNILNDYKRERRIRSIKYAIVPNVLELSHKRTLIIDTAGSYKIDHFDPEILVLKNSAKINLSRLLQIYRPEQIIADGSNYNSYIALWKKTSKHKKIPFHYTGEKGAYIIEE